MEFKRSLRSRCRSLRHHGVGGQPSGEIFNEITHYLDGSNIYGPNVNSLAELRFGKFGNLNGKNDGKSFMLPDQDQSDMCEMPGGGSHPHFFLAGDFRVNENPGTMYVIYYIFYLSK